MTGENLMLHIGARVTGIDCGLYGMNRHDYHNNTVKHFKCENKSLSCLDV